MRSLGHLMELSDFLIGLLDGPLEREKRNWEKLTVPGASGLSNADRNTIFVGL